MHLMFNKTLTPCAMSLCRLCAVLCTAPFAMQGKVHRYELPPPEDVNSYEPPVQPVRLPAGPWGERGEAKFSCKLWLGSPPSCSE